MIVGVEKDDMRKLQKDGLFTEGMFGLAEGPITEFARIPYGEDLISIRTRNKVMYISYKDLTGFDWKFKKGTMYDILRKYRLKLTKCNGDLQIVFRHKLKYINVEFKLKEQFGESYRGDEAFLTCSRISRNFISNDNIAREVLFEVLLNIVQHNYRNHAKVEFGEIVKFCEEKYGEWHS